ncbi:MAG: LamG domain-containing protein [Candidatus Blackburnbacteria bacterium]|nr:LamG domain-containing protein [Candidatus Blackburnbacteria bacterium]
MLTLLICIPSRVSAANSGIFTVSLWVRPTSSIASQALVGKAEELRVFTDASGYAGCQIKSTTWQTASTGTTALTLNSWNHVACSYDKATLKIYVNGVLANSNTLTATIDDTANAILLGQDSSSATPYSNLTGDTDDFKFYNYARTQKQVTEDMGGGGPNVLGTSSWSAGAAGAIGSRGGGPVGYWKFDEGYGTTANNSGSGGSALNGTLTSMASPATSTSGWTQSGKFGRGLNFDGTDDYVTGVNTGFSNLSALTISFWYNTTATSGSPNCVISSGSSTNRNFQVCVPNNYLTHTGFEWYSVGTGEVYSSNITSVTDGWHHAAVTYSSGTLTFYRDAKVVSTQGSLATLNSGGGTYVIGLDYFASWYKGSLDEVKIYPYALTADEVKLDYNKGSSQVLGALSDNSSSSFTSSSSVQGADHEYCIPGDTTSCAAPVGRWDFDENTGSTVNDKSGNNNTGTWNGTLGNQWKPGKIGASGNFNGSNNYVSISDNSGLNVSNITIEAWFKVNTWVNGPSIFNRRTAGNVGGVSLEPVAGYGMNFYAYIDGAWRTASSTGWNPGGVWEHVVATYNGSNMYIYRNGVQVGSTSYTGSINNPASPTVSIGTNIVGGTFWNGLVDQVRIFNYARSAAQIAWDYNRGAPIGHWKMDECQGTTVHDSSGNANHGTITATSTLGKCTTASTFWGGSLGTGAGKFNYAPTFNGSADYVSVANESNFDFERTNAFTIGAWVKTSSSNTQMIFAKMANTDPYTGFDFHILNTGVPRFLLINTYSTSTIDTQSTKTVNDGSWHQVIVTYDGSSSASGVNFYIDGILISKSTAINNLSSSILNNITPTIGSRNNQAYYWNGQLDDVRVYNYALTPLQVKLLYNQNSGVRFGPSTGAP